MFILNIITSSALNKKDTSCCVLPKYHGYAPKRYILVLPGLLLIIALLMVVPVSAAIITISPPASGPTTVIQNAINSAKSNDTIVLEPGIYNENGITITGKNLTFKADTIHGHGPSDTIIDGQNAGTRIFTVTDASSITINNLTIRNGKTDGSGGAIFTEGSLIITSSTFSGCSAGTGNGGAISSFNSGSLIIISSTFSGCWASEREGTGGAISSFRSGSLTITSSTFTYCLAFTGGAIFTESSLIITSSTFSGCQAGSWAYGGAIYSGGGTMHFCRIYNDNIGHAVSIYSGSFDASDNWWGSNSNPSGYIFGNVTTSPWLVLGVTASPPSINPTQTSIIQANLTYSSGGNDLFGTYVPDNIPVFFPLPAALLIPQQPQPKTV